MRTVLERIPSSYLALFIGLADATLWLTAFPFLLYCRGVVNSAQASTPFLLFVLVANVLIVVLMVSAVAATSELIRRGFTRAVRVPLPILARARSKRSQY